MSTTNPVDDFLEGFKEQVVFTPRLEAEHRQHVKTLSQLAFLQREADRAAKVSSNVADVKS
jgi:hypothetical protein